MFIPGERTSPRKRTGRGNGKGPGGVVLEEMEENGDLDEEGGVELDEDTFQKVTFFFFLFVLFVFVVICLLFDSSVR